MSKTVSKIAGFVVLGFLFAGGASLKSRQASIRGDWSPLPESGVRAGSLDPRYPLGAVPWLCWNTFLGSISTDEGYAIAVDSSGNAYVTGWCWSTWGSPIRPFSEGKDAFVVKLDRNGTLQWSTFLGGIGNDIGRGVAVDSNGNAYVTGISTWDWGSPIRPFTTYENAFVAKLDANGALVWNTFLGGPGSAIHDGYAITLDSNGDIWVTGASSVTWGSPVRPFSGSGSNDAFVAQLDTDGALQRNTFLGSSGDDQAFGITADGNGNVYVTGQSWGTWGSPILPYLGWWDVFVAKLNGSGALQWNTFLGTSDGDWGSGIDADASGNTYVSGSSRATWGTPVRPFGGGPTNDAFAAKLDVNGALQWNTFLGGPGTSSGDSGNGIALDANGNTYVTGISPSTWGSPARPYTGGYDAFVAKLDRNGSLRWNAFLGVTTWDDGWGIAADLSGNVYVVGTSPGSWGSPIRPFTQAQDPFAAKIFGGGPKDFVGSWDGLGVFYRGAVSGNWTSLGPPAEMIACGDLFGDGRDELIGVWASLGGLWFRNSADGVWTYLCSAARYLATADMNGDGLVDLLGTWDGLGVFYRSSISGQWALMAPAANKVGAGDLDGDGKADLIGLWPGLGEIWSMSSKTGVWSFYASAPRDFAAGDMNGDGRADLVGTWDGLGVFYRDSISGAWVQMAPAAEQVTTGDLDADGTDDLAGLWPGLGGEWAKYSSSGGWTYLGPQAHDLATGYMGGAAWGMGTSGSGALEGPRIGVTNEVPLAGKYADLSASGPGGIRFVYRSEKNRAPGTGNAAAPASPGPGQRGFRWTEQKNLRPQAKND